MKAEIVTATREHVEPIASRARRADCAELWASARATPVAALHEGLDVSSRAWTGLIDGDPICMFGVAPGSLLTGVGVPWMVGTDGIERHQFAFLRRSRPCVAEMLSLYHTLTNYVDDRNTVAIRWLRWLGFKMGEPSPFGAEGLPFRPFVMVRSALCATSGFSTPQKR